MPTVPNKVPSPEINCEILFRQMQAEIYKGEDRRTETCPKCGQLIGFEPPQVYYVGCKRVVDWIAYDERLSQSEFL